MPQKTSEQKTSPYAIVKTGGKQYRVQPGQRLLVERLATEAGKSVTLEPLMYRGDEVVCDGDGLAKVKVTAKVIGHERGEKLRVAKFKPKRGYRRRTGHRQELTRIEVTDVSLGSRRKPAEKSKASTEADAPAEQAGASGEVEAAATQPAAAKPAAKPKAAAKAKPAATKDTPKENSDGS